MKKLFFTLILLCANLSYAKLPDIVALVNDAPITKYDFQDRKKMLAALNNVDASDPAIAKKLNHSALEGLIMQELLFQHAESTEHKIEKKQIDMSIKTIEKQNGMPEDYMRSFFQEHNINMKSFRNQIKGEIIKQKILQSLANSVDVANSELSFAKINTKSIDFAVEAFLFSSKEINKNVKYKMQKLQKRMNCDKAIKYIAEDFIEKEDIQGSLRKMPSKIQSVIMDTKAGKTSPLFKDMDGYKFIVVCKKSTLSKEKDIDQIKNFLSHKKHSQSTVQFMKKLKSKAYIKRML